MEGYLGETIVDVNNTEFKDYKPSDWALYFIERYGQYDGGHHKQWVLDQIARILKGTKIIIKEARWDNGQSEYRISTDDNTSEEYKAWAKYMLGECLDEENQEYMYSYDEGVAP